MTARGLSWIARSNRSGDSWSNIRKHTEILPRPPVACAGALLGGSEMILIGQNPDIAGRGLLERIIFQQIQNLWRSFLEPP
jgi:hypothetical protein